MSRKYQKRPDHGGPLVRQAERVRGLAELVRQIKLDRREHARVDAIAEHRGRLLELTELRTLTELIKENGKGISELIAALKDREQALIRQTHLNLEHERKDRRSGRTELIVPIVE